MRGCCWPPRSPACSLPCIVIYIFPLARGSGVNQTKAALYIYNGYIPLRTAVGKFITAALAIGSGQSLGPEDPSLQIGASLASAIGRKLRLSRDNMRLIAPVGAAAGLAAAFNAPISAVLFVIEEVIGRWTAGILGSVVLSAVSSVVVMRWFLGSDSMFRIPPVELKRPSELIAYSILGIVGGLASVAFSAGVATLRPICRGMSRWTQYLQPAVAGLLIGIIAVMGAPQVMGAGYVYIDEAMHGQFTWQFLAILALLKIVATLVSFVSGTPGGMFAPTLFIGAMLGAAVGGVEHALYPHLSWSPGTFALVGMGVLFAGFLRCPHDLRLHGPGGQRELLHHSAGHHRQHHRLRHLAHPAAGRHLRRAQPPGRPGTAFDGGAARRIHPARGRRHGGAHRSGAQRRRHGGAGRPPRSPGHATTRCWCACAPPAGAASARPRSSRSWKPARAPQTLESVLAEDAVPSLHPDLPLDTALRYVDRWPLVPVVNRANLKELEGVITQRDVLERYREFGEE